MIYVLVVPMLLQAGVGNSSGAAYQIMNPSGRAVTTRLNGNWQTIVDPFDAGYFNYRMQPDPNGFFRNQKPRNPSERVEYDFDRSPRLRVPGDWNSQRTDLLLYEGTVWYRRRFDYALRSNRRLFVQFGGANYEARVWLNGVQLGSHEGGFTPFAFEITKLVRKGSNDLIVKVDNRRRADGVPTLNFDWWNYGGLTRDVILIEEPQVFVREYSLQIDRRNERCACGWVQLEGSENIDAAYVEVRIPRTRQTQTVITDTNGRAQLSLDASKLTRWTPENPALYDVEIITLGDTIRDRIGFRTIAVRGSKILLNGRPIFLRGISIHEESPFAARRAVNAADARELLKWVKQLNGNFARLAHYPHNEAMVRAADELGILIWAEIPVYWTIQWTNPATFANARQQLAGMIERDRNRASIVFWSVANETPRDSAREGGPRLKFLRGLVDDARRLDSTRLITAALEHRYVNDTTIMIDDPLGAYLDVLGNNEYLGWYDGPIEKADRINWRTAFDKPLVMSEFGGDARYGLHGPANKIWTEEYQEALYVHQIAMLERIPFLSGMSPWILKDFRSPRRPLPGIQDYFNRKGLVSERRERKKAFEVLRRFYSRKTRELQ
jgi:beta-glucuronidase